MSTSDDQLIATRESIKARITEMYRASIRENANPLITGELLARLRAFMLERCSAIVTEMNRECDTTYARTTLQADADAAITDILLNAPQFASRADIVSYREMYSRAYAPHVANDFATMLLPDGRLRVAEKSKQFDTIVARLIDKIEHFLLELTESRYTLQLLQPPFGEERSFDIKLIVAIISRIDSIAAQTYAKRANLRAVARVRATQSVAIAARPQTIDTRHYAAYSEAEQSIDLATYAIMLRNNAAAIHRFAVINADRIDAICKQALKNAKYG